MLVPLDKLTAHGSDMTPLHTLPLKCSGCSGREVELFLFVRATRPRRGQSGDVTVSPKVKKMAASINDVCPVGAHSMR